MSEIIHAAIIMENNTIFAIQNSTQGANDMMSGFDNSSQTITSTQVSSMVDSTEVAMTTTVPSSLMTSVMDNATITFVVSTLDTEMEDKGHNSSVDYDALLQIENSFEAKVLTPVTVYLIIMMVIGVFGNLLVLYVYKFRFKRSTSRVFILSLAAFDLMTCLLGMPYHILDMVYPYMFVWDEICKAFSFSLTFTILASIFVLDLIAIDRYRKICIPFEKQLSAAGTKMTCWVTALIAAVLAIPIIFIYGSADVDTRIPNVTGKECYVSNDLMDTGLPLIYDVFNILVFTISVFILTGLYIKVGIVVWERRSFHDSTRDGSKRSNSGTSTPDTIVSSMHTLNDDTRIGTSASVHYNKANHENTSVQLFNSKSAICKTLSANSANNSPKITRKERDLHKKRLKRLMSELSTVSGDESTLERGSGNSKFKSKKHIRTIRITTMLFIITVIFVISFLPYLIISILNGMDDHFWNDMSTGELVIINLLMRTYFINNMVNPIVYWFLDKKFKQEVYRFFRDIRKCKWSKTFRLDHKSYTS